MLPTVSPTSPRRHRYGVSRRTAIRRRDFALECFPESTTPEVAVARLNRWIRTDPQLLQRLQRLHYNKRSRSFSIRVEATLRNFLM